MVQLEPSTTLQKFLVSFFLSLIKVEKSKAFSHLCIQRCLTVTDGFARLASAAESASSGRELSGSAVRFIAGRCRRIDSRASDSVCHVTTLLYHSVAGCFQNAAPRLGHPAQVGSILRPGSALRVGPPRGLYPRVLQLQGQAAGDGG